MATTIKLKNGSGAPLAGDLVQGEPALDLTNKRLYTEDSGGTVIEVGTNPTSLTTGTFTSTGIDDNATSTAITIDSSQNATFGADVQINSNLSVNTAPNPNYSIYGLQSGALTHAGYLQANGTTGTALTARGTAGSQSSDTAVIQTTGGTATGRSLYVDHSGSGAAVVIEGGNVGIGTASPDAPLHIQTASGSKSEINLGQTAVTNYRISIPASTDALTFVYGASTERMRIDSSGNVGIGTSSITTFGGYKTLHFKNTGGDAIQLNETDGGVINQILCTDSSGGKVFLGARSNHPTVFCTNDTERMRLDASGNLLVGRTSSGTLTVAGSEFQAGGAGFHIRDGGTALFVGRKTSDGNLVEFSKDGTTAGSIGVAGSDIYIASSGTFSAGLMFEGASGAQDIRPCDKTGALLNGAVDLGDSSARFKDLYLSGGAYLGGTGAANHLDDYEEGTWTPEITGFGQSTFTQTYSQQTGKYVKVGDLVVASFYVTLSSKGNISGAYTHIKGLPFNHGGSVAGSAIIWGWGDLATASVMVSAELSSTTTVAWLTHATGAVTSTSYMNTSVIGNTTSLRGTLIYRIS